MSPEEEAEFYIFRAEVAAAKSMRDWLEAMEKAATRTLSGTFRLLGETALPVS